MINLDQFLKDKNLSPLFIYHDLHLDKTRKIINNDLKNLAGIYMILNKVNGDFYIGSASTNRLYNRFVNHLIYYRGSKLLKNATNKYGLIKFSFIILEIYPEIINKENNKKLLDIEDFYLKSLLPNYNILTEAGSSFGYKHTEISRIKMKAVYSQKRRNLSLNTIENIRQESKSVNKKYTYSKESILRMKKRSIPVVVSNKDGTIYGEYSSITEAASNLNCADKTIRRALKTDKKLLKRQFIVSYKNI
jgi:group I intron endonuclease